MSTEVSNLSEGTTTTRVYIVQEALSSKILGYVAAGGKSHEYLVSQGAQLVNSWTSGGVGGVAGGATAGGTGGSDDEYPPQEIEIQTPQGSVPVAPCRLEEQNYFNALSKLNAAKSKYMTYRDGTFKPLMRARVDRLKALRDIQQRVGSMTTSGQNERYQFLRNRFAAITKEIKNTDSLLFKRVDALYAQRKVIETEMRLLEQNQADLDGAMKAFLDGEKAYFNSAVQAMTLRNAVEYAYGDPVFPRKDDALSLYSAMKDCYRANGISGTELDRPPDLGLQEWEKSNALGGPYSEASDRGYKGAGKGQGPW